jgi:Lrp/AsnC family transcriptional regulator for asnA, asnC and gidA
LIGGEGIIKELDAIDAKIIKDLLADARKSFVDIASECNVSTATIGDRFTQLEKEGIIVGSTIQVDRRALGYNAICNVQVTVDPKETEQVLEYVQKLPFDIPNFGKDAKNSVWLIAGLKNLQEVGKLKEIIRRNKFVYDLKIENWTDVRNTPENLEVIESDSEMEENSFNSRIERHEVNTDIDRLDLQIMEKMLKNSMQPFGKIAKEVGTSINTVSRKYKRLTESRTIKPCIQINLHKLGYHAVMIFTLTFSSQSDTDYVLSEITQIKDNTLIIKTSGAYDLFVYVMLKDINQLLSTQEQIAKIPGISKIEMLTLPVLVPWPTTGEYISTF